MPPPSDRFKPIQRLASHRERKAAAELGESLRNRDEARQRLSELESYLAEYLDRFAQATRSGLSGTQLLEYQVFINKLEAAIAQQRENVDRSQRQCDSSKAQWQGRVTHSKAVDNAVGRMQADEQREQDKREQSESDEFGQRKR
jgi:flagellar FliJ protein